MSKIKLSRDAALKVISYSGDSREQLMTNINVMDNNVNAQFSGLRDPAFNRYLELSGKMQELLRQIGGKMEAVSQYCQSVIRWIDEYSES